MADRDFVVNTGGILLNANVTFSSGAVLIANGAAGSANQVLGSNSSGGLYWKSIDTTANTLSIYTFSNTVTLRGNVVFGSTISANGGLGSAGQIFVYNGSNSYWVSPVSTITLGGALTPGGTNSNPTISLNSLSPNPSGQYGLPAITVDSYGRITTATTAGAGGVLTMSSANASAVTVTGSLGNTTTGYYGDVVINTTNLYSLGTSTSYTGQITVDTYGRVVSGSNTMSANVGFANNYLLAPALKAFSEYVSNLTTTSSTTTIDLSTSNFFIVNMTRNTNLAFTNAPSGKVFSFNVVVVQDNSGGWSLGLSSSSKYPNMQSPVSTTTSNAIDVWTFTTYNGGTTYIASLSIKDAK